MPKHLVFEFGVFHALLFAGVFGFVPSPTNVSVVCHNFVNVLYWNYSNPTEQLKFSVKIGGYLSGSQTVDTPQTYLDISSYSSDVGDNYLVLVTAHDGPHKSESVSIKFTYSQDFIAGKNPKCSLDFPPVNTSVHKDMIEVSIQHPFFFHKQYILKERFTYTVTHDEQKFSHSCFVKDKLCTVKIHLNESTAGQCVELKFEGKIAGIPLNTYRNVCVPQQLPETVPSPTNVSVVCHNFVNVLYWNYSNPTEQLKFSVKIGGYLSGSQTVDTPQTYLDISSYSSDVGDNYLVLVTAHDGPHKSESVSIKFTYSQDFTAGKKPKCSLDFPPVNTSVHKDMIEVSIQHPFFHHKLEILDHEFTYTVTHDEQMFSHSCFVKDELCTVKIHLNESTAGQCVELKFEGKIAGIPLNTYRNVCVPQQLPETVPSPTNVSVVCHNFVNVLYWNYSTPTEQLKFSVKIGGYLSGSQTVDTPQTYLDISSYSSDVGDNYLVLVTAHDGPHKSESVSIKFTYSQDFTAGKKPKCSLDFPPVNTSVHKDMIEVSIHHPFFFHKQDILKERFTYTVTHDEQMFSHSCFVKDELCTVKIHLNESTAGQCVELKFEGKIAGIPLNTYRNVCVPQQMPKTDQTGLIAAVLGVGAVMLFIIIGFVWLLWKKWSKIPKTPQSLWKVIPGQSHTILVSQPERTTVSSLTSQGHKPLLTDTSPPIFPDEDCKENTTLETDLSEVSEEDVNCDDSEGFGFSSDYDSPKFLQEMSPGDNTEGYGPRPPVL
ncbi:uncharacterized protein LOC128026722 [Carassius gibelio]|uniref:uncharacterized protein LOC128026722 n=1 Tax=Carassius gibelio TaxID=101364 RepID=UPI0022788F73|nr:uncharacterized protein LOC128026722 [Carassius gibelio]